jgi:hypothetical protein
LRFCLKNIGPGELNLIPIEANKNKKGKIVSKTKDEKTISNNLFITLL